MILSFQECVPQSQDYSVCFVLLYCSCRLGSPTFYYAFLAPVLVILVINTGLLIKCIWFLMVTFRRHSAAVGVTRRHSRRQAEGLLGIGILVGVTWLVGIPMFDEARLPFQYVFAILNSLQGLAIFVFHFASNEDVRHSWEKRARKVMFPMKSARSDFGSRLTSVITSKRRPSSQDFTLRSQTESTRLCSPARSLDSVSCDVASPQSFSTAASLEDSILY